MCFASQKVFFCPNIFEQVADDGYGVNVKIPSILIDVKHGEKLIKSTMEGQVSRDPVMVRRSASDAEERERAQSEVMS